jgi:putative addiction module component (TIGR02574 family)
LRSRAISIVCSDPLRSPRPAFAATYPTYMAQSKLPEDPEQRLLALAPADRLALATRLLASVEGPDADRDEAWSGELDRRDAQFDSGGVAGIPAAEVHASAWARLRARSSKP